VNYKEKEIMKTYFHNLDKIFEDSLLHPETSIVISNASIKNNFATLILHVHSSYNILAKTIHYTVNITFTEMELFAIKYGIKLVS